MVRLGINRMLLVRLSFFPYIRADGGGSLIVLQSESPTNPIGEDDFCARDVGLAIREGDRVLYEFNTDVCTPAANQQAQII